MKETILLFNVPDKEKLLKMEMALYPLHIRLKLVSQEDYNQSLGTLAGITKAAGAGEVSAYDGAPLPGTMIVFAFFDDNKLNQALAALKKCGAGPFPYKAVLTPTNQLWTAPECFAEIKREHEQMTGK